MNPAERRPTAKPRLWMAVKAMVGLGLVAVLVWKVGPAKLILEIRKISPADYLLALAAYVGGEAARTVRWQRLLQAVGETFRLPLLIRFQLIGTFFNHLLPTSVGGDGVRIFYICQHGVAWEKAVGSVLVERVVGMLMLLLLGVIAGIAGYPVHRDPRILAALLLFAAAFAAGGYLLFSDWPFRVLFALAESHKLARLRAGLERFSSGVHVYRGFPRVLLFVAAVSLAFQVLVVALFYFFGRQLQMQVPLGYYFIIVPLYASLSMMPLTPGGLGVREWACTLLFVQAGAAEAAAASLPMLWLLLTLGAGCVGALAFVTYKKTDRTSSESEKAT